MSKTKTFGKYTIYISLGCKLKEDYIILFNKLNKSNIHYTSICYLFNDITKLNYLREFNLDFNKIKRIIFEIKEKDYIINEDYKSYFSTFFYI